MVTRQQRKKSISIKKTSRRGFTLLELLVVMVIVGILATQVVAQFNSADTLLKGEAFMLRNNFNMARGRAVKENREVIVEFFMDQDIDSDGDPDDGYRLYMDDDFPDADDDPVGGPFETFTPGEDTLIREVVLQDSVKYYDTDCTADGGPPVVGDGVAFVDNTFIMRSDGTSNRNGSVTIYFPERDPTRMRAAPYKAKIGNFFRITLERWRTDDWSPR